MIRIINSNAFKANIDFFWKWFKQKLITLNLMPRARIIEFYKNESLSSSLEMTTIFQRSNNFYSFTNLESGGLKLDGMVTLRIKELQENIAMDLKLLKR